MADNEYFYEVGAFRQPTITDEQVEYFGGAEEEEPTEEIKEEVQEEVKDDVVEDVVEETPEIEEEPEEEEEQEEEYQDHSAAAIYAAHLKEIGFFEKESFEKDIEHQDLIQSMIKKSENIGFENAKAKLIETYGGEETLKTAQFLLQGGDPAFINKTAALTKMSSVDLKDDNFKDVISFAYKMQGIDDDDAKLYIETHEERGELKTKAEKAQAYISNLKEQHMAQIQNVEPEDTSHLEEQRKKNVKSIINKKDLGPIKLDDLEGQKLYDFITKPSFVQKRNVQGVNKNVFITGLEKAYAELSTDLTKQIIIAKILMDDFQFTDVARQVESEVSTSVLDTLNRKTSKKKKTKITNAFLRD